MVKPCATAPKLVVAGWVGPFELMIFLCSRLELVAQLALVIVNAQETPYDDVADLVVREPIGTALPRLVAPG